MRVTYTIGQVSKLMNISIYTLRYYDEIGLFKPAFVDPQTNYRHYDDYQLYQLDWIKSLRAIGTPLEKIQQINQVSPEEQLTFLEEQEQSIKERMQQLNNAQKNISQVRNRIIFQQNLPLFDQVEIVPQKGERILRVKATEQISPHQLLNSNYRELKRTLEVEGETTPQQFGTIFPLKSYQNIDDIRYDYMYTALEAHQWIREVGETVEISKIKNGRYAQIICKYSPLQYMIAYNTLLNYIEQHELHVEPIIFETFMILQFNPIEEIVRFRVKLIES